MDDSPLTFSGSDNALLLGEAQDDELVDIVDQLRAEIAPDYVFEQVQDGPLLKTATDNMMEGLEGADSSSSRTDDTNTKPTSTTSTTFADRISSQVAATEKVQYAAAASSGDAEAPWTTPTSKNTFSVQSAREIVPNNSRTTTTDRPTTTSSSSSSASAYDDLELVATLDRANLGRPTLADYGLEKFLTDGQHPAASRATRFERMLRNTLTSVVNHAASPLKSYKTSKGNKNIKAETMSMSSSTSGSATPRTAGEGRKPSKPTSSSTRPEEAGGRGTGPSRSAAGASTTQGTSASSSNRTSTTPRGAGAASSSSWVTSLVTPRKSGATATRNRGGRSKTPGVATTPRGGGHAPASSNATTSRLVDTLVTPRGGGILGGRSSGRSEAAVSKNSTGHEKHESATGAARATATPVVPKTKSTYQKSHSKRSSAPGAGTEQVVGRSSAGGGENKPMLLRKMTPVYGNGANSSPGKNKQLDV
ncbi:unnamed protein product [Amoebophrya sp. A120]|nr:unnamed protein product [Amoebophrya sp. A120]|eukprot:GSA120T00005336001.1